MSELETLKREMQGLAREIELKPIREDSIKKQDKELWQPNWRCFCCEDKGVISIPLLNQVLPDYKPEIHGIPICNRCDADIPDSWRANGNTAIGTQLCNLLHEYNKLDYRLSLSRKADDRRTAREQLREMVDSF